MAERENQNGAHARPTIELVGITKYFGDACALNNITLAIPRGEFLVLLGPSGCGKSTILKIIAGLEDSTEGEVYINGALSNYMVPKQRDVAMVFQNYALYPHMTVERNIGFPLRMQRRLKSEEIRRKVALVASMLEVGMLLDRYPEQLSGGQRQRVALGRALIRDPKAFLLDEPLSNLDALLRVQMREELLKLHRRIGITTVYVTHDQIEAMTMADRIAILRQGVLQQVGRPQEVYSKPCNVFVATFVGSPQMTLIRGEMVESPTGAEFKGPSFTLPVGGRYRNAKSRGDVSLGVRPEHVSMVDPGEAGAIPGMCDLVEFIGSDIFVSIAIADGVFVKSRSSAGLSVREGQRLGLKISVEDVHLFDSEGKRIPESVGWSPTMQ